MSNVTDECWKLLKTNFGEALMRVFRLPSATSLYDHVRFGGHIPIRLKNQQPPARRLADFL